MYELDEDTKKIDFSHNPFSIAAGRDGGALEGNGSARYPRLTSMISCGNGRGIVVRRDPAITSSM